MNDELEPEATAEELLAAEALRAALGATEATKATNVAPESADADFARSLAMAHADPAAHVLDEAENAALLDRAYRIAAGRAPVVSLAARRKRVSLGATASAGALVLAAAASVLLVTKHDAPMAASSIALSTGPNAAVARSTEPLFAGTNEVHSGSARIDRIARVRDSEFLEARIDAWQLVEARR